MSFLSYSFFLSPLRSSVEGSGRVSTLEVECLPCNSDGIGLSNEISILQVSALAKKAEVKGDVISRKLRASNKH